MLSYQCSVFSGLYDARLAKIHERDQTNQRPTNQQRHNTVYRNLRLSL